MTEHEKTIERLTTAFAKAASERDSAKEKLAAVVAVCENARFKCPVDGRVCNPTTCVVLDCEKKDDIVVLDRHKLIEDVLKAAKGMAK